MDNSNFTNAEPDVQEKNLLSLFHLKNGDYCSKVLPKWAVLRAYSLCASFTKPEVRSYGEKNYF